MSNPIEWYIRLFWPNQEIETKELTVRYRLLLYFNFYCALVMLYSIIKWSNLDYTRLVYTSAFGLLMVVGNCFFVKTKPSPMVSANIILAGTFPHGANMIYSLGGLHSAHLFWMPALICISYLLSNRKSGFFWFGVSFATIFYMIYLERTGHKFPVFEMTEAGKKIDTYSGYLLPMIIIWLGQSYSLKIREEFLSDAVGAQEKTAKLAATSEKNYLYLGEILEEAKHTCQTLSESTDSLVKNLQHMENTSLKIEGGANSQVDAAEDISSTVLQTKDTLEETSSMVMNMENITQETEHNVTDTAESMTKASDSMSKIKQSFSQIEDVIQVISEIVSQTNLLALNATIEAARAGDRGRGFAVVADEIRSLSIRCDQSAQEIATVIRQGSIDVEQGVELVTNSANILTSTANNVQDVTQQIHNVADIISRLNKNMEEVAAATDNVGAVSRDNAGSVSQLLETTALLSNMTGELVTISTKLQKVVNK